MRTFEKMSLVKILMNLLIIINLHSRNLFFRYRRLELKIVSTGHARKVGRLTAEIMHVKTITVLDPSIDIRHRQDLEIAWNSLVNPAEDVEIIKGPSIRGMDPSRD